MPAAVMLVPSILACFLSTPYMEVSFVTVFDDPYISAGETFRLMFGDSWQYVWPVVLISVFQVLAASMIMSAVDRHFRTGTLSLRSPIRLLNYSVFPIALGVAIMCALSILLRFVMFGLVMLIQVSFSAMRASASVALIAISIVSIGMFIVHILIITSMLYWAPSMFIYGYKFRDAVASSIKMMSGKKLSVGLMIPMIVCALIQLLVGFLDVHIAISITVGFVIYLFTNVYVTVYVIVTFYTVSGLDRRDIEPYKIPLPSVPPVQKPDKPEKTDKPEQPRSQAVPTPQPVSDNAPPAAAPTEKPKKSRARSDKKQKPDQSDTAPKKTTKKTVKSKSDKIPTAAAPEQPPVAPPAAADIQAPTGEESEDVV